MMTDLQQAKLKRSLVTHEGRRKYPYIDTVGKITLGIGYNATDRGMTDEWIDSQYQQDVTFFYNQLCAFPWYLNLNPDRQIILIDMAFMGWKKFLGFKKMIVALELGDHPTVAFEMLNSDWACEVKSRATVLAHGYLTGVYEI